MITLTSKAVEKVKAFAAAEKESQGKGLRIFVEGGGCSGFQYGFAFDKATDNDTVLDLEGIKVLVDTFSAPYLENSTVDYVEGLQGAGFVVKNPNAKSSCGCGSSFGV